MAAPRNAAFSAATNAGKDASVPVNTTPPATPHPSGPARNLLPQGEKDFEAGKQHGVAIARGAV